jgi:DNA-directed RNA polymerase-3 subunit RPC5
VRVKQLALRGTPVALRQREHGTLAVATFSGGALHLSPISGVVALRPSLAHLDAADEARRETERQAGRRGAPEEEEEEEAADGLPRLTPLQVQVRRRETERQAEARLASHAYLRQQDEEEPWRALAPCGPDSPRAAAVLARMRAAPPGRAGEALSRADYLASLLPPRPSSTAVPAAGGVDADMASGVDSAEAWLGIPRTTLDALPLHERMGAIFAGKQRQVLSFAKLERLAPLSTTTDDLLRAVAAHAVLVQGVWVSSSQHVSASTGDAVMRRDAALLLFCRSHVVTGVRLASLRIETRALAALLEPFAAPRPREGDAGAYELREPRDEAFISAHPDVVAQQDMRWAGVAASLAAAGLFGAAPAIAAAAPAAASGLAAVLRSFAGNRKLLSAAVARSWLASSPAAAGARAAAQLDDAALAAALGSPWMALAGRLVCAVTGDSTTDPVRRVVLDLLREKAAEGGDAAANPSLRKADVQRGATAALRGELPAAVYTRVMGALCTHAHGAWVLQTGDEPADKDAADALPPGFVAP